MNVHEDFIIELARIERSAVATVRASMSIPTAHGGTRAMNESNPNAEPPAQKEPVVVTWDPDCPAVCIKPGVEVSEVRFTDGRERFLPNRELEPKSKIGPKRWARIMSELPTDSARALFVQMFGTPEGVKPWKAPARPSNASPDAPARPASVAATCPAKPTAPPATSTDSARPPRASAPRGKSTDIWDKMAAFMATPRTMEEIAAEFGWLKHSASARVSGLKKVRTVVIRDGRYSVVTA